MRAARAARDPDHRLHLGLVGIVFALLAFDLGVRHRSDHEIDVHESLLPSAGHVGAALLFGTWVWRYLGAPSGMDCDTGYLIEKSLSMDNDFVMALIFSFFALPQQYQHRVPFRGILGVIVLGATLVSQTSWVLYPFGAFLVVTGIKMWFIAEPGARHREQPRLTVQRRARATPATGRADRPRWRRQGPSGAARPRA